MILSEITTGTQFDVALATSSNDSLLWGEVPSNQLNLLANSAGTDLLLMLEGNDLISDGSEDRIYMGMLGDDTLCGNQGADTLAGGRDADLLIGGKGQDILTGDFGNDVIFGDLDNDILDGGAGNDSLTGGEGRDIFMISNPEGFDFIVDFQKGIDLVQLPQGVTFSNLTISTTNAGLVVITNTLTNQPLAVFNGIQASDLTAADFITGTSDGTPDPFGERIFSEYKAFLSPEQEPGEDIGSDARGVGTLRFAQNLSYGEIELQITGVEPSEITGIHVHCGPPGVLGPIVLNLGQYGTFDQTIVDGKFSARFTNENITFINSAPELPAGVPQIPDEGIVQIPPARSASHLTDEPHSDHEGTHHSPENGVTQVPNSPPSLPLGTAQIPNQGLPQSVEDLAQVPDGLPRLPEGCPVELGLPGQVNTVAGVEAVAREGALYFNVHTEEHNFYGEMRGQVYPNTGRTLPL